MLKYLFIAAGILFVLTMTKDRRPAPLPPLSQNDTVLCVGDSLTYGYGASAQESYPSQLAALTHLRTINAGINGETSSEGLLRLPSLLQKHRPKLTVICFGGNDILQKKSMEKLKENLKKMVDMAKASQSGVLLIAVPNLTLFGLEPLELYEEVAEETDTPLLSDILAEVLSDPSLKSDQIHPNGKGYGKIAEAVAHQLGY